MLEESDSDEDIIVAYKELYQLNTAVTKYTTTTTTATTSQQQNILQNIPEGEVEGKVRNIIKIHFFISGQSELPFLFYLEPRRGGEGRFAYLESVLARRHLRERQCAGCGENLSPGNTAVFTEGPGGAQCWHSACFSCSTCGLGLAQLTFYCNQAQSPSHCRSQQRSLKHLYSTLSVSLSADLG